MREGPAEGWEVGNEIVMSGRNTENKEKSDVYFY